MNIISIIKRYIRQDEGATTVEFSIVASLFFMLILVIFEAGIYMYNRVAVEAIALQVSRMVAIGKESASVCQKNTSVGGVTIDTREKFIRCIVDDRANKMLLNKQVDLEVQINPITKKGTQIPDICITGALAAPVTPLNPNPPPVTVPLPSTLPKGCTAYQEVNGVGGYQGLADSDAGTKDQIIEVRINFVSAMMSSGFYALFGNPLGDVKLITAVTVVKNEDF